jgi:hypothetical protein
VLSSWLYVSAQRASAAFVRSECRRKVRELEADSMQSTTGSGTETDPAIRPLLDEAMLALKEDDRAALLLRFFQKQSFSAIAAELRLTEDAVRKRTERALEKLRIRLTKRGITSTAGAIGVALGSEAEIASTIVPTLAPRIVQQALVQTMPASAFSWTLTLFKALAPASSVVLLGGFLISVQRGENDALESEIAQLRQVDHAAAITRKENTELRRELAALEASRARITSAPPAAAASKIPAVTTLPHSTFKANIFLTREGTLQWNTQAVSLKEFLTLLKSVAGKTPDEISRLALQVAPGAPESAVRYVFEEVIKAGPTQLQIMKVDPPADEWF